MVDLANKHLSRKQMGRGRWAKMKRVSSMHCSDEKWQEGRKQAKKNAMERAKKKFTLALGKRFKRH